MIMALLAALAIAMVTLWVAYGLRHIFKYSLGNSTLDIQVLGITCRRLPFSRIEDVEVIPFMSLNLFSRSFRPDLLFAPKWSGYRNRVVAIRKDQGLLRSMIISPEDPDRFAELLKKLSSEAKLIH
jgi:hypothetical protein